MDKWVDGVELARFEKSLAEDVRLSRHKWTVGEYVDIRVWSKVRPGDSMALVPTESGLCLAADLLPDLRAAIDRAIVALGGDVEGYPSLDPGGPPGRQAGASRLPTKHEGGLG